MTRLPTESRAVKGMDGPEYPLGLACAKLGCFEPSREAHHLWRRSELIGAHWWAYIEDDDVIVGNVIGLCRNHHHAVTVNAAWITWKEGQFTWSDMLTTDEPLQFQPPVRLVEDSLPKSPEKNGEKLVIAGGEIASVPSYDGTCPTCLRPLPHPKSEHEPKRVRRTWSITVPVDERENGAEALTTLLEEGRKEMARAGLPYGAEETANYFVLASMLGLFVAHADSILSDA
jgi:hypothetical protein